MLTAFLLLSAACTPGKSPAPSDSAADSGGDAYTEDTGCEGADTGAEWPTAPEDTAADGCDVPIPATFESLEELDCGLGADSCVWLCRWRIVLESDGTWYRSLYDFGESGEWSCSGSTLLLTPSGGDAPLEATYTPETGRLVLEDIVYAFSSSGTAY